MDKTFYAALHEMRKLDFPCTTFEHMRSKDGVHLWRIFHDGLLFVLKYFENPEYRREIENYSLLKRLGVPTLHVLGMTDRAILMEDVSRSEKFRLGEEKDMSDPEIARKLAQWYKKLHSAKADLTGMYDESNFFTRENIAFIKEKTGTGALPVWGLLDDSFDGIKSRFDSLHRVITYNDFYYTNLIVARDKSSAFMFDYNLLGKGFALSDVRNVTYSLSPAAAAAFRDEYGPTDPMEKLVDDVISPITTLYMACRREIFPKWAGEALETVRSGMNDKIIALLNC